jgi:Leucine-rich repeat (LRR) protein
LENDSVFSQVKNKVREEHLKEMTLQVMQAHQEGSISSYIPLLQTLSEPPLEEIQKRDFYELTERQLFLQLLRVLHPDRCSYLTARAEEAHKNTDEERLGKFLEVLSFKSTIRPSTPVFGSVREEYRYDEKDFDDAQRYDTMDDQWYEQEDISDFIAACKAELAGNLDIMITPTDLSHLTGELVVSNYGISELEGLAYCEAITVLDLSHNQITNLYDLKGLGQLEELDLSDNEINDISDLAGLCSLQVLDLSDNDIDDLSPLLGLYELQYLHISGNPAVRRSEQINELLAKGVVIITF